MSAKTVRNSSPSLIIYVSNSNMYSYSALMNKVVIIANSINICCTTMSFISAYHCYVDRVVQDCNIFIASALEILPSCTKLATCNYVYTVTDAMACIYGIEW